MSGEQYSELARLWHDYTLFGLPDSQSDLAIDFSEWIDEGEDGDPRFGLPEIEAFLREKERRENPSPPEWAQR